MNFLRVVKQSIYGPAFYRELLSKPFSFSLKYFLALILLLSFVLTVFYALTTVPRVYEFFLDIGPRVLNYYPEDLTISFRGGQALTNAEEPYSFPFPGELGESGLENLFVIDTANEITPDRFASYKTLLFLSKSHVAYYTGYDDGEAERIEITSLRKFPDVEITRESLTSLFVKIRPYLKFAVPIVIVGIFFAMLFIHAIELLYLLVAALAIWLIAKLMRVPAGYKKSYQFGLHAITLPFIVAGVTSIISFQRAPFIFSAIMLVVVLFNLRQITPSQSEPPLQEAD